MKSTYLILSAFAIIAMFTFSQCKTDSRDTGLNMSVVAVGKISQTNGSSSVTTSLNDGITNIRTGPVRIRPDQTPAPLQNQYVEYEWTQPVRTGEIEVFWWDWEGTLALPQAYRLTYWDGNHFVPVKNPQGLNFSNAQYNKTTFDEVETTKLRLEIDSARQLRQSLLEWKVNQSPNSRNLPPIVATNGDRTVMLGTQTYLTASIKSVAPIQQTRWTKVSGPGTVTFAGKDSLNTTATFSQTGEYNLSFLAVKGHYRVTSNLIVKVVEPPAEDRLEVVYTKKYSIDSPLWNDRAKAMIVNWIPWCIDQCERTNLTLGPGGLDNFIEAAKALRGLPFERHKGFVFANAWVHQTIESICIALMIDAKGDREILAAQEKMKKALEKWIPIVLSAQEPDGYLQTAYTLRDTSRWTSRWNERNRSDHEGYVAGYFIESAINHYTLTNGTDLRLYNAAKKLADCWATNIGPNPGQIEWFDGHQGMEMALVRFGRFVNDMEGSGKGDRYIALAKFLLDSRKDGSSYDQSHVPVQQQYEAVGHAVRAVYQYSAMSDIAVETKDPYYQSATMSIWDNMINKKYYVTGGVGSGDTSEGFGDNYSLSHNAYCEACSSCALMFFQYKLNMAYHDAKYADLY
ncbi:MAG: glycoside hydrolase family 127 protein, partial [Tannerella sp.]|nr:glycoside hydrolase family 127 protein [Tannerella sp.]